MKTYFGYKTPLSWGAAPGCINIAPLGLFGSYLSDFCFSFSPSCSLFGYNAIELKGINDPLTLIDYNKIMMRAWGLGAFKPKPKPEDDKEEQSDNTPNPYPSQRTLTIICVTRPTKLLAQLETEVGFTKQSEGIYHCPD
jgi:putative component of membrane protein insertase Oxa1/YidC/SpoIIIJ protein YidD